MKIFSMSLPPSRTSIQQWSLKHSCRERWTPPARGTGVTVVCLILSMFLPGCKFSGKDTLPGAGTSENKKALTYFFRGTAAMEINSYEQAQQDLESLTEMASGEPAAWANLALLKMRKGEDEQGVLHLQKALDLAPDEDRLYYLMGNYQMLRGNSKKSLENWNQAIQINPLNHKAAFAIAKQRVKSQDPAFSEIETLLTGLEKHLPVNLPLVLFRLEWSLKKWALLEMEPGDIKALVKGIPESIVVTGSLQNFRNALDENNPENARVSLASLKNILMQNKSFQQDLSQLQEPLEFVGLSFKRPLRMILPEPSAPAPDTSLTFEPTLTHPGQPGNSSFKHIYLSHDLGSRALVTGDTGFTGADFEPPIDLPASLNSTMVTLDFNYDFIMDAVLVQNNKLHLWTGSEKGSFTGSPDKFTGELPTADGGYQGLWTFDHEADGDLDLLAAPVDQTPVLILQGENFSPVKASPFPWSLGVRDFVFADLNGDGRKDASLLDYRGEMQIYFNQGAGKYIRAPALDLPLTLVALQSADLNHNSYFEILALDTAGRIHALEFSRAKKTWNTNILVKSRGESGERPLSPGTHFLLGDLDNNTELDFIISDSLTTSIWLSRGNSGFVKLPEYNLKTFTVSDVSDDGNLDLWGLDKEGREVMYIQKNTAGYHWQSLKIQSKTAMGDRRINSFGIGSEVEVRMGLVYQKRQVTGPLMHFGLGNAGLLDIVRIIWPNGSVQTEFDLPPDKTFFARQRLKGSCPWVFGYNGKEMAFIKDFLWRSPLGLKINAQVTVPIAQTEDRIKIPGPQLQPRGGIHDLRITAELWETHFIDELKLFQVDHPAGTQIHVDERFGREPASLETVITGPLVPIHKASTLQGRDVTDILKARDDQFLGGFDPGPYQGLAAENGVILRVNIMGQRPHLLIARGWIYPTDSSINVALGQGHPVRPRGIRVEYLDVNGKWQVLHGDVGFPAGKCKNILIDLAALPAGEQQVRLSTNMEIYWDSFHTAEVRDPGQLQQTELPLEVARLDYRGFSKYTDRRGEFPELPLYNQLRGKAQEWRDLEGYYTRYGDVIPLLKKTDDAYIIMNAGDEISLEFRASEPPPAGITRDFILMGDGWVKDGDYNTVDSRTVGPLPVHAALSPKNPVPGELDGSNYQTRYVDHRRFQEALVYK